jgi:glycogen operon protein
VRNLADRFVGSPSIYAHKQREAEQSVNFVTCHDGFTLNDLVSYSQKHNEANGEKNADGANDNYSWNCGVEGATGDASVETLRNRQVKNFFTVTLLALGMPMILMGDEVRRTQQGNNNAYCHDDESVWFDWSLIERHSDVFRFVQLVIGRRLKRDVTIEQKRLTLHQLIGNAPHAWHGVKLFEPDWGDSSHSLAFSTELRDERLEFYMIFNSFWEPLEFELPRASGAAPWRRWIDTALDSPDDIAPWDANPPVSAGSYRASPRSLVVLRRSILT